MKQPIDVLGLTVSIGTPVQASFLPTPRGLTVLYGLNGAGKSQLLLALEGCLRGRDLSSADCDLVVRVGWSEYPYESPQWALRYVANWAGPGEKVWSPEDVALELTVDPQSLVRRAIVESLERYWVPDTASEADLPVGLDLLASEIAEQGLFFLEARDRGHVVRIGAMAGEGTPQIASVMRRVSALGRSPDILKERDEDGALENAGEAFLQDGGLFDPMEGDGEPFASAANLTSDKPPFAMVYDSERFVGGSEIAEVITESGQVPDIRAILQNGCRTDPLGGGSHSDQLSSENGMPGTAATTDSGLTEGERRSLKAIEALAQKLLDAVLLDAPTLELKIGDARDWLLGRAPTWRATARGRSGWGVPLSALSSADSRWATLAVTLASRPGSQCPSDTSGLNRSLTGQPVAPPLFVIIDEPEAHLHRSAEAFMAQGLAKWAAMLNARIVVASHSPELLDSPSSNLMSVGWNARLGHSTVQPLGAPARDTMERFGLTPSDLLRRQRGFILVEGLHDQIVLDALIGDELRSARVDVLPLRGAKQLPTTVDSQFLFDYTDAHVIVMLDAIGAKNVRDVWQLARALSKSDPGAAGRSLREGLPGNAPELRWMREFLSKALDRGIHDRLTPFGLQALDVIEYLPAGELVPRAPSWTALRDEFEASGSRKDFKSWLTAAKQATFTPERLRAAANTLDSIPEEFVALANHCMDLPATPRSPVQSS